MISEKIAFLKELNKTVKMLKENIGYADIYQLENLNSDNVVAYAEYGNFPKTNVLGIIDDEKQTFYSFSDNIEFPIKKKKFTERLFSCSYDESDIGKYFVLNISKTNLPKFSIKDLYYYSLKYSNYLKKTQSNSVNKKRVYKK